MPNTGIEPATLLSLVRRSNQLSYAAAKLDDESTNTQFSSPQ